MRAFAPLLILFWLLAYAAPSWVLVRFHMDRERIVLEECVQRGVSLENRTCFGQCHLVKELNELEKQEQGGVPGTVTVKWEPEAMFDRSAVPPPAAVELLHLRPLERVSGLLSGIRSVQEGVPRS